MLTPYRSIFVTIPALPVVPYWQGEIIGEGILNFLHENHSILTASEMPSDYLEEHHYWEELHCVYPYVQENYQNVLPFLEYLESTRKAIKEALDLSHVNLLELVEVKLVHSISIIRLYESAALIIISGA